MRTITSVTLDVGLLNEIREISKATGAPISALVDLGVRYVAQLPLEKLQAWAFGLEEKRGRPSGGLRKAERACLEALAALEALSAPTYQFGPPEIARKAGLKVREAHVALPELERRKLVRMADHRPGEVDKWQRPTGLMFWRVEAEAKWRAANGLPPLPAAQ